MADMNDLVRQIAYYQSGGKDAGNSNLDQFNKAYGTISVMGKDFMAIRKAQEDIMTSALARKKTQMEIDTGRRSTTPIEITAGRTPIPGMTAGIQAPGQVAGMEGETIVQAPTKPNLPSGLEEYGKFTPEEIPKLAAGQKANAGPEMVPVSMLQGEPLARALALGISPDSMIDVKKFNAFNRVDPAAPVGTIKPEDALKLGSIPGNTKVIDPRGTSIGDLSPGQQTAAFKLSDDFRTDSTDFVKKRNSYNNIVSSAREAESSTGGSGDLALIYAFTKLQDPTMVTEQEIQNAVNTGSFGEQVKAAMGKVLEGKKLTPEIREGFVKTGERIYREALNQQKDLTEQYKIRGDSLGIDSKLFLIDYEAMDTRKPINQGQTTQPKIEKKSTPKIPAVGEKRKGYIFTGGDPANQNNWIKEKK